MSAPRTAVPGTADPAWRARRLGAEVRRGTLALLEGQLVEALLLNPMITVAAGGFLIGGLAAPLWAYRRGTVPKVPVPLPRWSRTAIVVVILANWAWVIVHA